jgi:hypothetical protein
MQLNKRSHNQPLRGLDLNRCAGFGLCGDRYVSKELAPN